MVWYEVNGYTGLEDSAGVDGICTTSSLKKAYREFEKAKTRYPKVRIDKWEGESMKECNGDYVADVECWRGQ